MTLPAACPVKTWTVKFGLWTATAIPLLLLIWVLMSIGRQILLLLPMAGWIE
jgi:hypothetical protein